MLYLIAIVVSQLLVKFLCSIAIAVGVISVFLLELSKLLNILSFAIYIVFKLNFQTTTYIFNIGNLITSYSIIFLIIVIGIKLLYRELVYREYLVIIAILNLNYRQLNNTLTTLSILQYTIRSLYIESVVVLYLP